MKKFYFFLLILFLFPLNTFAKIAYIDLNLILNNSDVGKFVNEHIDKIKKEIPEASFSLITFTSTGKKIEHID